MGSAARTAHIASTECCISLPLPGQSCPWQRTTVRSSGDNACSVTRTLAVASAADTNDQGRWSRAWTPLARARTSVACGAVKLTAAAMSRAGGPTLSSMLSGRWSSRQSDTCGAARVGGKARAWTAWTRVRHLLCSRRRHQFLQAFWGQISTSSDRAGKGALSVQRLQLVGRSSKTWQAHCLARLSAVAT